MEEYDSVQFIIIKTSLVPIAIACVLFVFTLYFLFKVLFIYRHISSFSFSFPMLNKATNHVEFFSLTAEKSARKKSYRQITHKDERKEKSFI